MKEFEFTFDKGLRSGLRKHSSNPRNEQALVECHNLMPTEAGLEVHKAVTDLNADGVAWGGLGKQYREMLSFLEFSVVKPACFDITVGNISYTLATDDVAYVYKDYGVAGLARECHFLFSAKSTSMASSSTYPTIFALSEGLGLPASTNGTIFIYWHLTTKFIIEERTPTGGNYGANDTAFDPNVLTYFHIAFYPNYGSFGRLYYYGYTDDCMSNLISSGHYDLHATPSYRYLYACAGFPSGGEGDKAIGNIYEYKER